MSLFASLITQAAEASKYRNTGGRPVDPSSKRQQVLAYLDEQQPATIAEIALALGVTAHEIYAVVNELKREEQVKEAGKEGRAKLWRVAE